MDDWRSHARCAEIAPAYDDPTKEDPAERSILYFFFDGYESNPSIRPLTQAICAQCPVRRECLEDGLENNETGVRAGVYLNRGHIDPTKNVHKAPEDWEELKELLND